MSISWKYIDLNINSFEVCPNTQVHIDEEALLILITNLKSTSIIRYDPLTLDTKSSDIDSDNSLRHFILSSSGTVYKLNSNGSLFRLVCTSSSGLVHGSVFGSNSSESSLTDTFSWAQLNDSIGNVVTATDVDNGFAVIKGHSEYFSFLIYSNFEKPVIQCSKRLQCSEQENWKIFSFKSSKISQKFKNYLFGELSFVLTDLLVASTHHGTVSLYPVLSDKSSQNFYPIHYEANSLIHVAITPCKNAIILIYKHGCIVFTIFDVKNETIIYRKHYLSSTVETASVLSNDSEFSIIWSDGITTNFTTLSTLADFSCCERKTTVKGIVAIKNVNKKILLFNINCCSYVAELGSDLVDIKYSEPNLKNAIIEVSKNISYIKKQLQIADSNINAMKIEEMDTSQLLLSKIDNNLCIENLSSLIFRKEQWLVILKSKYDYRSFMKKFNLSKDFVQFDKNVYPLQPFLNKNCSSLTILLISRVYENQRLLRFTVGSINISP